METKVSDTEINSLRFKEDASRPMAVKREINVRNLTILHQFVEQTFKNSKRMIQKEEETVRKTQERDFDSEDSSDKNFLSQSVVHINVKRVKKRYTV